MTNAPLAYLAVLLFVVASVIWIAPPAEAGFCGFSQDTGTTCDKHCSSSGGGSLGCSTEDPDRCCWDSDNACGDSECSQCAETDCALGGF